MNKRPILIVGQGLAGSLLALELIDRGQGVVIIDQCELATASRIATGLVNPVTGMRLAKTAYVDQLLPIALVKYRALAHRYNQIFYHPRKMLRLFQSADESIQWQSRVRDLTYRHYLDEAEQTLVEDDPSTFFDLRYGYGWQKHCGYLDTAKFLDCVKAELTERGALQSKTFSSDTIQLEGGYAIWQGQLFKRVVFCEGFRAQQNPWFSWLPFQPVKGEVVTVEMRSKISSYLVSKKISLIPSSLYSMQVGSTYEWSDNIKPTTKAKNQLLHQFDQLFMQPQAYHLINHQAGIRPATQDKQPFLGCHPKYSALVIMNGFGSKGVLQAPYYAQCLADFLLEKKSLPVSVDIKRFGSLYPSG